MDFNVVVVAIPEILTQMLGFVIVFLLLKKYIFGTILQTIEDRQRKMALSFEEMEQKKVELDSLKKEYQQKLQEIDQESRMKIQEAVAEGQRIATEMREKARTDALEQLSHAKHEIKREIESARATARHEVVELSILMAGKLIGKNLSSEENERYVIEILSSVGELA